MDGGHPSATGSWSGCSEAWVSENDVKKICSEWWESVDGDDDVEDMIQKLQDVYDEEGVKFERVSTEEIVI